MSTAWQLLRGGRCRTRAAFRGRVFRFGEGRVPLVGSPGDGRAKNTLHSTIVGLVEQVAELYDAVGLGAGLAELRASAGRHVDDLAGEGIRLGDLMVGEMPVSV